jgi:3-dehydroquinate dehydratase type I
MNRPRICTVIVDKDDVNAALAVEPFVDLYEVRIDLIGDGWQEVARRLPKPWLATNRVGSEGGQWQGDEGSRVEELLKSLELGAQLVDIELETPEVERIVREIKRKAKCIVSFHDWNRMPPLDQLEQVVRRQLAAGADICKVVGRAEQFEDNVTPLELVGRFPDSSLIALSIGPEGVIGRTLSPLLGGYLTYATAVQGKGSAPGQSPAEELRRIFDIWQERTDRQVAAAQ